jgi:uncharacterized membrane protein
VTLDLLSLIHYLYAFTIVLLITSADLVLIQVAPVIAFARLIILILAALIRLTRILLLH